MSDTKRKIPQWVKDYIRGDYPWVDDRKKNRHRKGADGVVQKQICGSAKDGKLNTYDDIYGQKSKSIAGHQIRRHLNRIDIDE